MIFDRVELTELWKTTLQTRLLALALDELCKPAEGMKTRTGGPEPLALVTQNVHHRLLAAHVS